jgi:ribonuclease-3
MRDELYDILGYRFKNTQLLDDALRHASGVNHRLLSNERMEFLGDAVLGYVVCAYLYRTFPEMMEGDLTKIKSAVVSRKTCTDISRKLGLGELMIMGKGMSSRPSIPDSVWAAAFEAVIAAIYLDGGIEPAERFILKHLCPIIEETAECSHQENFKSVLQHHVQKYLPTNPSYVVLDEKGPDHAKAFEVCVQIEGRQFSSAWAKSKKQAEQDAALRTLCELGLAHISEDGTVIIENQNANPDA